MNNFSIYLSLLVCLGGLVLYFLSVKDKPAQIGVRCFTVGLLVFLMTFSNKILHG